MNLVKYTNKQTNFETAVSQPSPRISQKQSFPVPCCQHGLKMQK